MVITDIKNRLSKEEIEKQEILEAAYDLYCEWNTNEESRFCFNIWKKRQNLPGGGFVLLIKLATARGIYE